MSVIRRREGVDQDLKTRTIDRWERKLFGPARTGPRETLNMRPTVRRSRPPTSMTSPMCSRTSFSPSPAAAAGKRLAQPFRTSRRPYRRRTQQPSFPNRPRSPGGFWRPAVCWDGADAIERRFFLRRDASVVNISLCQIYSIQGAIGRTGSCRAENTGRLR